MKKVIKISLLSLVILVFLLTAGIIYLNNVFLPRTIKALIIQGIEDRTNSKVTLGSLKANIFKGLVLSDLNIYKGEASLVKVKEASCLFFPWSLLEKKIAIPVISLNSAQIFIERRKDNTLNLADLFAPEPPAAAAALPAAAQTTNTPPPNKGFSVFIYRINISNAKVIFQDSTFEKPFIKSLENINLKVYLSLPASVKFKLLASLPGSETAKISGNGEFKIRDRELAAKLEVVNLSAGEFAPYYARSGLKLSEDFFNLSADIKVKNNLFYVDVQAQGENFNILRGKVSARMSLDLRAILEYGLIEKKLKYSGSSKIYNTDISGIDFIDKIQGVNCGISFDNAGLAAENFTVQVLGLPVKAKISLANFLDPDLKVNAASSSSLERLQGILKDQFKFSFPGAISGQANLFLLVEGKLFAPASLMLKGNVDLINASLKAEQIAQPIQGINGKLTFLKTSLSAPALLGISLESDELALGANLAVEGKLIKINKCAGSYPALDFSLSGNIDTADSAQALVDLTGELAVDLSKLDKPFPGLKGQLAKIKPEGALKAAFALSGKINDLRSCSIEASASSEAISLYGLKGSNLILNYAQAGGLASVPDFRLSLYGGSLGASFKANLNAKNYSYLFSAHMQDVKIEELKLDTRAKNKDIAGAIQADFKSTGFLSDLAGSTGAGRILINKGKLWELDLFKGMGKLLFSQEFSNIIFYEGSCDFIVQDKLISTSNLLLKSNMVNLSGPVKIGFDDSLDARLNVDIISELVPLTGTFKDVTTAIMGQTGRFAQIRVTGTLKEPKYKFEAAVADIIKGLADTFLKRI